MKKIKTAAAILLTAALMLGGCAQSKGEQAPADTSSAEERVQIDIPEKRQISDYSSVMKIDGVEVPFLLGEDEIKNKLGDQFSEWIDFKFPMGVDPTKALLLMPFFETEQDICEIRTYSFNYTFGDTFGHTIDLFGMDGLYIPIHDLNEKYKDNLIKIDDNNYEMIYVNGDYAKIPDDLDEYTKELDTMLLIDRSIDSYMVIDMMKSPEDNADFITFTVMSRTENYEKIEA